LFAQALDDGVKSLYSSILLQLRKSSRTSNQHRIHLNTPRFIVNTFGRIHHHALPLTGSRVAVRATKSSFAGKGCPGKRAIAMNQGRPSHLNLQAQACLGYEDWLSPPGEGGA
jgi:hypothetical protein